MVVELGSGLLHNAHPRGAGTRLTQALTGGCERAWKGCLENGDPEGLRMRAAGDAGIDGDAYQIQTSTWSLAEQGLGRLGPEARCVLSSLKLRPSGSEDSLSAPWLCVLCSRVAGSGKGDWRLRMTRKRLHPAEF